MEPYKYEDGIRLSRKQRKVVERLKYFDFGKDIGEDHYSSLGINGVKDSNDGANPILAYFEKTQRGRIVDKCLDVGALARLLDAHKKLSLHIALWKDGVKEGTTLLSDFDDEPMCIKELFKKEVLGYEI